MATYVLMSKLTPEMTHDLKKRRKLGQEWKAEVERRCPGVKWVAHYVLLGPYDFLDIYEAPNEEAAAKVSMITLAEGAMKAESWTAIPYQRFLELVDEVRG